MPVFSHCDCTMSVVATLWLLCATVSTTPCLVLTPIGVVSRTLSIFVSDAVNGSCYLISAECQGSWNCSLVVHDASIITSSRTQLEEPFISFRDVGSNQSFSDMRGSWSVSNMSTFVPPTIALDIHNIPLGFTAQVTVQLSSSMSNNEGVVRLGGCPSVQGGEFVTASTFIIATDLDDVGYWPLGDGTVCAWHVRCPNVGYHMTLQCQQFLNGVSHNCSQLVRSPSLILTMDTRLATPAVGGMSATATCIFVGTPEWVPSPSASVRISSEVSETATETDVTVSSRGSSSILGTATRTKDISRLQHRTRHTTTLSYSTHSNTLPLRWRSSATHSPVSPLSTSLPANSSSSVSTSSTTSSLEMCKEDQIRLNTTSVVRSGEIVFVTSTVRLESTQPPPCLWLIGCRAVDNASTVRSVRLTSAYINSTVMCLNETSYFGHFVVYTPTQPDLCTSNSSATTIGAGTNAVLLMSPQLSLDVQCEYEYLRNTSIPSGASASAVVPSPTNAVVIASVSAFIGLIVIVILVVCLWHRRAGLRAWWRGNLPQPQVHHRSDTGLADLLLRDSKTIRVLQGMDTWHTHAAEVGADLQNERDFGHRPSAELVEL